MIASAAAPITRGFRLVAMSGFLASSRTAEEIGNYRLRGVANCHAYLATRWVGSPGGGPKGRIEWQLPHPRRRQLPHVSG